MKRRFLLAFMAVSMSFAMILGGCGSSAEVAEEEIEEDEDDDDDDVDWDAFTEPQEIKVENIDFSSADSVLSFVRGTWYMADKYTGTDYASIEIKKNGSVVFTRLSDQTELEGSIGFSESYYDVLDGIHYYEITLSGLLELYEGYADEDTSSGHFMIVQSAGQDYMYLEELGNGGSFLMYEIFNSPYAYMYDGWFDNLA